MLSRAVYESWQTPSRSDGRLSVRASIFWVGSVSLLLWSALTVVVVGLF
jgi:hypothetical protein